MSVLDQYESAHKSFRSGAVMSEDNETLLNHLSGLANQNNTNEGTQHRDIVRGLTINHILLQRHIDGLNKQNAKTQRWVIALAVASLIATAVQTTVAIRAELREEAKTQQGSPQPPQSPQQAATPTQVVPRSSDPATKKAP
jgi:hypothetical protein